MKRIHAFLFSSLGVILSIVMVGCKDTGKTLTSATGSIYECLVVMNNQALTQDELNAVAHHSLVNEASGYSEPISTTYDLVKAIMAADMPAMPDASLTSE